MMEFFKHLQLPLNASAHGGDVDKLIIYVHILMLALFIGWAGYFLYAIFRFRAKANPKADYLGVTNHASSYVEVAVAAIEGVLLFAFAVPLWAHAVAEFPKESESTVIRIVARQFNWTARYPGPDGKFGNARVDFVSADNQLGLDKNDPNGKDDIESPDITVPVNKEVIAYLTSMDVIHSFKVVPLRVTQDANPGMVIPIHFKPTATNTYQIQCSQLCGNGHYSMRGTFKVIPQADYDVWLKSQMKPAGAAKGGYD
ncbi:MAG TPA: cytochrome c oxidase subunit II [Verrucomicrobiae bacterium]|jgi:cytochrome c oxidase subunit 2